MKISARLTPEDCVAARWTAIRPRPLIRYLGYAVLALYCACLIWQAVDVVRGRNLAGEFWWMLGVAAYLGFLLFVVMPWRVRRIYRQQKALQRPFEMEFGDTRFSVTAENGSFSMAWADFHKWKKGAKVLLLYQSEAIMHPIPRRAFSTEADFQSVVRLLEEKLGPEKP